MKEQTDLKQDSKYREKEESEKYFRDKKYNFIIKTRFVMAIILSFGVKHLISKFTLIEFLVFVVSN